MNIVIPFQGRVQTVIRSSFLAAKRQTETQYQLTGEAFQMTGITNAQVVILPDTINVVEGQELDTDLLMEALPLESFVSVSAEEVKELNALVDDDEHKGHEDAHEVAGGAL